jgi:hypothetical protein
MEVKFIERKILFSNKQQDTFQVKKNIRFDSSQNEGLRGNRQEETVWTSFNGIQYR